MNIIDLNQGYAKLLHRLKAKKNGINYSALCPFHEEKTPSFTINVEKRTYYCFGCAKGGTLYGLQKHLKIK